MIWETPNQEPRTKYNNALILGLGSSGVAATRLLLGEGTQVTAVDSGRNDELARRAGELEKGGAKVVLGADAVPPGDFDVCVTSPGIPSGSEWIGEVEKRGIKVLSELELGASRIRCPLLAVTGTNGKSTMVKLCSEAITAAGKRAVATGNYGLPLCDVVEDSEKLDWAVVEVSSFQVEKIENFRPRVGVLLNIQPDHLDRYGSMDEYRRLKARVFGMPGGRVPEGGPVQTGIVHDEISGEIREIAGEGVEWKTFGLSSQAVYRYENGCVTEGKNGSKGRFSLEETLFDNVIMGLTAAAAVAAMRACDIDPLHVVKAVREFEPLAHRMQEVGLMRGVRFVNDSKASNLAALGAALDMTGGPARPREHREGAGGPVRLIAGGLLKEKDLKSMKEVLARIVEKVYLIGAAQNEMENAWRDAVEVCRCDTLEMAVRTAWKEAEEGETVLLSPGCASFDQFRNFEERGDKFCSIMKSIKEET